MTQVAVPEETVAGSQSNPRLMADLPDSYLEFQPTIMSERKDFQGSRESLIKSEEGSHHMVSTLMDDMQDVISFGKTLFLKPRMETLTYFKDSMEHKQCVLEAAENNLDALDLFIQVTLENMSSCIGEWDKRRQLYTDAFTLARDGRNPSSNITSLNCPGVSQQSYEDMLKRMVQICSKIVDGVRTDEIRLCQMSETSAETRKNVGELRRSIASILNIVDSVFKQEYVAVFCLLKRVEQHLDSFAVEWKKGDVPLTPRSNRLYMSQPSPSYDRWVPPQCPPNSPCSGFSHAVAAAEEFPRQPHGNRDQRSQRQVTVADEHVSQTSSIKSTAGSAKGVSLHQPPGNQRSPRQVTVAAKDSSQISSIKSGAEAAEELPLRQVLGNSSPRSARQVTIAPECDDLQIRRDSLTHEIFRRGSQTRPPGGRLQTVEDIVQRYNTLQNAVRDEMRSISNQNELISKSEAALKNRKK